MNHFLNGTDLALTDEARAEIALNAQFAVRLVDFLESKLDSHLQGESHLSPQKRVAYTCQIVEGLNALGMPQITGPLSARALDWLVTLPTLERSPDDEVNNARWHPSRFKTLAQMGCLDTESPTLQEFRALSKHVTANDGMLHDTPIASLPLATMIWLDTLLHLRERDWDISAFQMRSTHAYRALDSLYKKWLHTNGSRDSSVQSPRAKSQPKGASNTELYLKDFSDASYALNLLLRHKDLPPKHAAVRDGKIKLVAKWRARQRNDWRNYDALYCAIQLATHFHDDEKVQQSVLELIAELRKAFDAGYAPDQALPLAALSLRVLGALYGKALSDEIQRAQWSFCCEQEREKKQAQKMEHHAEWAQLLRDTFIIEIGDEETLSNSDSKKVLRVRFGFEALGVDDHGQRPHVAKQTLRIILKQGAASDLENAVMMYRSLPPALQVYFAEHAPTNHLAARFSGQPAYMVMRDLADMELLADIYQRHDNALWDADAKRVITQTARQVALAFQALHHEPYTVKGVTNQLERLYLTPLTASIDQVCATSFPTLRDFVEGGFDADSVKYKPLAYYLNELRKREEKIRPVKLGRIHGDAHSRNLMLDPTLQRVKFIDVEYFATDRDYLADYALLLEDIAFYQYLPHRQNTARLRFDQFNHTLSGQEHKTPDARPLALSQNLSPHAESANKEKSIRNAIQYPLLPIDSEAALLFQQTLLSQLKSFADSIGDTNWKARLWLATAQALLLLLERQTQSQSRKGDERDILNLRLVIYAEAIRLLEELVTNLMWQWQLPELPFRGARAAPHAINDRALSRQVLQLFDELPNVIRQPHPDQPPWLQFFVSKQSKPFAEFHNIAKEFPMELVLYIRREHLIDTEQLITTRSKDEGFVIPKSRLGNIEAVRALIQQTYAYALNARRE